MNASRHGERSAEAVACRRELWAVYRRVREEVESVRAILREERERIEGVEASPAVRTGRLDPRIANTVGYLAGVLIRAFEAGELQERLAALESVVRPCPPTGGSAFDHHREPPASGDEPCDTTRGSAV